MKTQRIYRYSMKELKQFDSLTERILFIGFIPRQDIDPRMIKNNNCSKYLFNDADEAICVKCAFTKQEMGSINDVGDMITVCWHSWHDSQHGSCNTESFFELMQNATIATGLNIGDKKALKKYANNIYQELLDENRYYYIE